MRSKDAKAHGGFVVEILARIDQYGILKELGSGGFGSVYLARDTVAEMMVAVKGLPCDIREDPGEREKIRENFQLVSKIHHPNIASLLVLHPAVNVCYADENTQERLRVRNGDFLIVMEYADGATLSRWCATRKSIPVRQVAEIVRQIAAALDYAHTHGILHRDIKPGNIIVEEKVNGSLRVRVLDFGLAAEIRLSMGRISCDSRGVCGTRHYMSPEQWMGRHVTAATDEYALAVVAYEMLHRQVPFESVFGSGDTDMMMTTVMRARPEYDGTLSARVRDVLDRGLAKAAEDRYATCGQFASEFADALTGVPANPLDKFCCGLTANDWFDAVYSGDKNLMRLLPDYFGQCDASGYDDDQWMILLSSFPEFAYKCDLNELNPDARANLVFNQPSFLGKVRSADFSDKWWEDILKQNPGLDESEAWKQAHGSVGRLSVAQRLLDEGDYKEAAKTVFKCRLLPEGRRILMECMMRARPGELDEYKIEDRKVSHKCPYFLDGKKCKLMSMRWEAGSGPGLYSDSCPYQYFWQFCRYSKGG